MEEIVDLAIPTEIFHNSQFPDLIKRSNRVIFTVLGLLKWLESDIKKNKEDKKTLDKLKLKYNFFQQMLVKGIPKLSEQLQQKYQEYHANPMNRMAASQMWDPYMSQMINANSASNSFFQSSVANGSQNSIGAFRTSVGCGTPGCTCNLGNAMYSGNFNPNGQLAQGSMNQMVTAEIESFSQQVSDAADRIQYFGTRSLSHNNVWRPSNPFANNANRLTASFTPYHPQRRYAVASRNITRRQHSFTNVRNRTARRIEDAHRIISNSNNRQMLNSDNSKRATGRLRAVESFVDDILQSGRSMTQEESESALSEMGNILGILGF